MSTLDNILAITRSHIDSLRAESADHAREATKLAEQMAEPTDAYRAMEAEERDLLLKLGALRDEMRTAKAALDAMADERDLHLRKADAAADAADHFQTKTLPDLAEILDGADLPPREDEPGEEAGHEPPVPAAELPGMWEEADFQGGATDMDDLVPPGAPVKDSRAEVAPHLPPPVPHGPDAGTLAAIENGHPLTTRTDHAPSPRGQHAAPPRTSRVTGALRKVGLIHDEQDGDQADG